MKTSKTDAYEFVIAGAIIEPYITIRLINKEVSINVFFFFGQNHLNCWELVEKNIDLIVVIFSNHFKTLIA